MTSTVNGEARGPVVMRAAFTPAIDTTGGHAEDLTGIAGVLDEAADRYETLGMTASTLEHLRDGAAAVTTAASALGSTVETLLAALADFNDRDGRVGDAVSETGNLMQAEGYTTTFDPTRIPEQSMTTGHPTSSNTAPREEPTQPVAADKLQLAGRARLGPGETVLGSRHVAGDDDQDEECLILGVQTPDGPQIRLGVGIPAADRSNWRGADLGATVVLDEQGLAELEEQLPRLHSEAKAAHAEFIDRLDDEEQGLIVRMQLEAERYPDANPADLVFTTQARDGALLKAEQLREGLNRDVVAQLTDQERQRWAELDDQIAGAAGPQRWDLMRQQIAIAQGLTMEQLRRSLDLQGLIDEGQLDRAGAAELNALRTVPGGIPGGWPARRDVVFSLSDLNRALTDAEQRQARLTGLQANEVPLDAETSEEHRQAVEAHERAAQRLAELPDVSASATISGQWGDLVVHAVQSDDPDSGWYYQMAVRSPHAGADWDLALSADGVYTATYRQVRRVATLARETISAGRPAVRSA
jgi:hypothetical protein